MYNNSTHSASVQVEQYQAMSDLRASLNIEVVWKPLEFSHNTRSCKNPFEGHPSLDPKLHLFIHEPDE